MHHDFPNKVLENNEFIPIYNKYIRDRDDLNYAKRLQYSYSIENRLENRINNIFDSYYSNYPSNIYDISINNQTMNNDTSTITTSA